jgi:hypothetical protein
LEPGKVPEILSGRDDQLRPSGSLKHLFGIFERQGKGLLHQHMLPAFDRLDRDGRMEVVGQADHNGIDAWIPECFLDACIKWGAVLFSGLSGKILLRIHNRCQKCNIAQLLNGLNMRPPDSAAADDRHPNFFSLFHLLLFLRPDAGV